MRDVARRVAVSVSTVSLALRNSPLVSAETRKAVQAAVEELGYRVNPYVAAHMRSRRKPHAGVAAPLLAIVDTQRRRHGWRDNRTTMVRGMLAGAKAQAAPRLSPAPARPASGDGGP
jgi:DNA-binding LacI/PurR family transcriptional regulator